MTVTDRINGLNQGVAYKAPVRVATTANITLSGEQTIDGVAVVANDRVLVKNQDDAKENGIYIASASAWSRSADFDGSRDVTEGTLFMVLYGSTSAGYLYKLTTTTDPVDFGVDDITFSIALDLSAISGITAYGLSVIALANVAANRDLLGIKLHKFDATAAPTVNDDSGDGYDIGSQWYDATNDDMYYCLDPSLGAAVWQQGDVVAADLGSAALATLIDDDTFATATSSNLASAESTKALVDNSIAAILTEETEQIAVGTETEFDFTGIPSGTKRITISFYDVQLGTDDLLVQIGDSGGIEAAGYVSMSGQTRNSVSGIVSDVTDGFHIECENTGDEITGHMVLTRMNGDGDKWVASHVVGIATTGTERTVMGGGYKTLSAELDRVRVTRSNSDTFGAGSAVNIMYE